MPDRDFDDLVSSNLPTNVALATDGWGDDIISNFDDFMKTWLYHGMLSATLDVQMTNSGGDVTLFTLTSLDYYVAVTEVLIFRRGTNPGTGTYSLGSNASSYNDWNDGFVMTNLTDDDLPLLVVPDAGGSAYSDTTARPMGIINNEDSPLAPSFRINYVSGNDWGGACDVYTYGALIKKGV